MGNMNSFTAKNYDPVYIKKGHKVVGFNQAKIIDQRNNVYLTSPWVSPNNGRPNYHEADGEYMVWKGDVLIAEFLEKEHALWFFNYMANTSETNK